MHPRECFIPNSFFMNKSDAQIIAQTGDSSGITLAFVCQHLSLSDQNIGGVFNFI